MHGMITTKGKTVVLVALCALCSLLVPMAPFDLEAVSIIDTKHNLSVTGPGPIKAQTETRVCVFCHTPHNAYPRTPLWNREVGSNNYVLYSSPSMQATPSQPNGPSRLCLSCHDGMIALGSVLQPSTGIIMTGQIIPGSPASVGEGLNLAGDHPVSFSYFDAASIDPQIRPNPGSDIVLYNSDFVECTTCHDPHEDRYRTADKSGQMTGKFLLADNRFSSLCLQCHDLPNWVGSVHQQSSTLVDSSFFPVSPRQWPTWQTVAEWGCEICHTSHAAQSQDMLLYYQTEAEVCDPCHGGTPLPGDPHSLATASAGIIAQTEKMSGHRMNTLSLPAKAKMSPLFQMNKNLPDTVTCADCHNSHALTVSRGHAQRDGRVRGSLKGVNGVDRSGVRVAAATYEYEICFKCHAENERGATFIPRVVVTTNKRLQFDTMNPSLHPVTGRGRSQNVPSLPSEYAPELTVSSMITCTGCHSDDGGRSKGPHGSSYAPILREQYETADHTPESYQSYALCYRCHNRTNILSDVSFQKKILKTTASGGGHSGHLAKGAPCSACHDAHGVNDSGSRTGDHTRLINFDTTIVQAKPGTANPLFRQKGLFSGSCTLVCHGKVHQNESYP